LTFSAGFALAFVWQWQVKRTALSITRGSAGEKGRAAQKEQEGELLALISEATIAFKAGKDAGEDIKTTAQRVLPTLVAKYPTTVVKHGKKLLKSITGGRGIEMLEDYL